MPRYSYECVFCRNKVARIVSSKEREEQYCNECEEGAENTMIRIYEPVMIEQDVQNRTAESVIRDKKEELEQIDKELKNREQIEL